MSTTTEDYSSPLLECLLHKSKEYESTSANLAPKN